MAGVVACATLVLPAAASANDFQTVYNNYKKHGTIKPCTFSEQQLRGAAKETPPDVEQYAPSFLDAIASAREAASGCNKQTVAAAPTAAAAPPTASSPSPAPAPASSPAPTPAPAPVTTTAVATATVPAPTPPAAAANAPVLNTQLVSHDTSAPAALWVLVVLGAIVVLAALSAIAAWWYGYAPAGMGRPRLEETSREFGDWLRSGV